MKDKIKILFIGDVIGEPGLKAVDDYLPLMIQKYEPDFIIINGENASGGKGITETESDRLFRGGVDVITTGNHVWENWKSKPLLAANPKVLRPLNYPPGNVGRGCVIETIDEGIDVAVINLQGRTFLQPIDCPFRASDNALKNMQDKTKIIIVDFHAEATAEKLAMGWHLDGRVTAVIGTHTHIQTADTCILPKGTGYITDVGMTGPYNSVVGMKTDIALKRLLFQTPYKYEMAAGDERLSGVFMVVDTSTGKPDSINAFMYPEPKRTITHNEKDIENAK